MFTEVLHRDDRHETATDAADRALSKFDTAELTLAHGAHPRVVDAWQLLGEKTHQWQAEHAEAEAHGGDADLLRTQHTRDRATTHARDRTTQRDYYDDRDDGLDMSM